MASVPDEIFGLIVHVSTLLRKRLSGQRAQRGAVGPQDDATKRMLSTGIPAHKSDGSLNGSSTSAHGVSLLLMAALEEEEEEADAVVKGKVGAVFEQMATGFMPHSEVQKAVWVGTPAEGVYAMGQKSSVNKASTSDGPLDESANTKLPAHPEDQVRPRFLLVPTCVAENQGCLWLVVRVIV